jgi:MFS family permease
MSKIDMPSSDILTSNGVPVKKGGVFYGWFVIAGVILVTVIAGGAFVSSFGVFLPVISNEFGWSRASLSLALSLGIAAFGLPAPLYGYFINKYGARAGIILGNSLAVFATAALFLANEIWHYYLLYIIIGLGNGLGGYIACSTLTNNWFIKNRALAMGIFTSSLGISGLIYPPVVTVIIAHLGFLNSWLVLAGFVLVGAVILGGVVLIKNRPEDIGQLPDGITANFNSIAEKVPNHESKVTVWQARKAFKAKTIWLIAAFMFADALAMGAVAGHQIAYIKDIGFSAMTAASTVSVMSVFNIIGSLAFGALSLKLNMRHLTSTAFLLQIASIIILLTSKNIIFIYFFAAFIGLSLGAILTSMSTFIGAYYPRQHYAQIAGIILPFYMIGQSISASAVGLIFDITNQYTLAFSLLTVTSLAGLICAFSARPPELLLSEARDK